ncbi:MAG TPA: glycosyltransferase N-terminal domain-containing protein [Draconibacterium sp.]|nr:glycosyltransferase N-terminal domain-containing protein [Draconibacterium sp.]
MTLFYKTGIFIYSQLIQFYSLFNEKAKLFVKGRKNWKQNLASKIDGNSKYIWFHCSSLGEFEQGRPVIEELKSQFPEYKIALTFFSPSGFEIRKNYPLADVVAYLPLDTKRNAQTFLEIVKPEKAFFVKYEFWYFYISELQRRNVPLYIVSAIFRENQQFFKNTPWGLWYRKILFKVEHLFVQNEKSGELLKSIGISNFTVTGDTRFDRVAAIARDSKKLPIVEKFKGNSLLIIAGSTWKPDEELLSAFINQSKNIKFIIAAHEVSAANINRIHQLLKKPAVSFSKVSESEVDKYEVLIIDSVGLLSSIYRYGDIAYIGGGFGVGIHNILEAATFGLPVIFGPNYKKFKEAVDLISEGGAFSVSNATELRDALDKLIDDRDERQKASQFCNNYVAKNVGSTKHIVKKVFNIGRVLN